MASFQAKIGWKRRRKRENKNCLSVPFLPDGKQKIPKKEKKIQKNLKIQLWLHFKPKQDGKGSERENKNFRFVSFRTDALEKIQEKQQKNSIN